jgi:hypothetical protein
MKKAFITQEMTFITTKILPSICKESGHNRRTCVKRKIAEASKEAAQELGEQLGEAAVEKATDAVMAKWATEEALSEAIELGLDCFVPGLGITVKFCRYA